MRIASNWFLSLAVLVPIAACANPITNLGDLGMGGDSQAGGASQGRTVGNTAAPTSGNGPAGNGADTAAGSTNAATSGSTGGAPNSTNAATSTDAATSTSAATSASAATSTNGVASASAATSGVGGANNSSSASSGGGAPMTCAEADGGVGCCEGSAQLYYCTQGSSMPTLQTCGGGTVCGWSAANAYYDCVPPPAKADPSNQYPIACNGGMGSSAASTSASASSAAASSSSTGNMGAVTWTQIYNTLFAANGSAPCSVNGGCHTNTQSGFKCGTSKATCYSGFVNSGLVTTGANAPQSALVDPNQSPLCGSLGGNMPKTYGSCISAADLTEIKTWLAEGAPNN